MRAMTHRIRCRKRPKGSSSAGSSSAEFVCRAKGGCSTKQEEYRLGSLHAAQRYLGLHSRSLHWNNMDDDSYTDACTRALRSLLADEAAARTLTLSALLSDLAASKLRDLEPDEAFFEALLVLPPMCWEDWALSDRCALHTLLIGLLRVPEVIAAAPLARPYITSDFLKACLEEVACDCLLYTSDAADE